MESKTENGRKQQTQRYDEVATNYDPVMRPLDRWIFARLRGKLLGQITAGAHVLEIGAGTGLNFAFYPPQSRGVASEPSREMLRIAASKKRPDGLSLVQSCAESLPFSDGAFDAAIATLVFCSVSSPPQAFSELRRVVKPGGTVLLLEHVRPKRLLGLIFELLNLITVPLCEDHINRRTAEEAYRSGLQLVRVESRFFGIINLISCRV